MGQITYYYGGIGAQWGNGVPCYMFIIIKVFTIKVFFSIPCSLFSSKIFCLHLGCGPLFFVAFNQVLPSVRIRSMTRQT